MSVKQTIKAIETKYNGYHFRSRTEARWAVFFDVLGLEWDYEVEGYDLGKFGWYLPDFRIYNMATRNKFGEVHIEIKGKKPTMAEMQKCEYLASATAGTTYMFIGTPKLFFDSIDIDNESRCISFFGIEIINYDESMLQCAKCGSYFMGFWCGGVPACPKCYRNNEEARDTEGGRKSIIHPDYNKKITKAVNASSSARF